MDTTNIPSYKIVVLGYYSVGKSSISLKYVKNTFNPNEESTIGASFLTKIVSHKDNTLKFEIWDTAGQERYNSLIPMYYRGANVALIVYDITKRESFEVAKKWVEELKIEKAADFLKVLVGNKIDLENREVEKEEAFMYAQENCCLFYECSAKSGYNVEKIFVDVADILPKVGKKKPLLKMETNRKNARCC